MFFIADYFLLGSSQQSRPYLVWGLILEMALFSGFILNGGWFKLYYT